MNGRLIRERRAAAGLTVRQLADQLGINDRTLADLERSSGLDADAVTVGLLRRICRALDLEPAEVIDPPTATPLEPADDRKVEAALIEHGGVLTRDDLAAALSWSLARLERALLSLEHRLKPTGLRLRQVGWNSYALSPNLRALTGEERRRLYRTHSGRVGLTESVAFILLGVVAGYRHQDWLLRLPPEDRRGIELLTRQGLIEPSSRERWVQTWVPTAEVLYSLCLRDEDDNWDDWPDHGDSFQSGLRAQPQLWVLLTASLRLH
jgi:transcriptional regulator with XRE-family HTH domain